MYILRDLQFSRAQPKDWFMKSRLLIVSDYDILSPVLVCFVFCQGQLSLIDFLSMELISYRCATKLNFLIGYRADNISPLTINLTQL